MLRVVYDIEHHKEEEFEKLWNEKSTFGIQNGSKSSFADLRWRPSSIPYIVLDPSNFVSLERSIVAKAETQAFVNRILERTIVR